MGEVMDIFFSNLKELRDRVEPVLDIKLGELKRNSFVIISKDDIWDFLKGELVGSKNLTLYDIINCILNIDNFALENFVIKRSDSSDEG